MEKRKLLYEGSAKEVYLTEDPDLVILHFKDDATAFSGIKKAEIAGKGIYSNKISGIIFERLEKRAYPLILSGSLATESRCAGRSASFLSR